jgi:hypothetical protein
MIKARITAAALVLVACAPEQPANNASNVRDLVSEGNADEIIIPQANQSGASAANTGTPAPALNLAPDGLTLVLESGAARQLAFGTPRDAAVRMVTAALGAPVSQGLNEECPAGALESVEFDGGLGLWFSDGDFAGWDLNSREDGRFTTAAGIGLGSTRRQLEDVVAIEVEDSSLGHEFRAGGFSGLLSALAPTGKITALWAGTTCIFR